MSENISLEQAIVMIAELSKQVSELKTSAAVNGAARNKKAVNPVSGRTYERLGELNAWGKVPEQQRNLADILTKGMELKKQYTEAEVFEMVCKGASAYPKLANSVQHPTYLFCYYRGLKNDGVKYAGFVGRNFLRQTN